MGDTGQNCLTGLKYRDAPCVNLNKTVSGSGETHKLNVSYKIDDQRMVYATYSTGYRPGGSQPERGPSALSRPTSSAITRSG